MDKTQLSAFVDGSARELTELSDKIWDYAETAFEEYKSVAAFRDFLTARGFAFEAGVGGVETAFCASFGSGGPVVGILAEYDALSGMSQKACVAVREPAGGGNGHGCGHNLLGAGALGAALAAKEYLAANKVRGTVKLFGCPGEEGGSGKAFMAREGVFSGLDAAVTWHPSSLNGIMDVCFLANYQILYKFKGLSSHAAAAPHMGRSALDAVELMNVGVQFLREHVIQEARIHYAITNTGGFSPNVVQGQGEVLYLIRAPNSYQVEEIYRRVNKIAEGAAMMTETEVEIEFIKACANIVPNKVIGRVLYDNLTAQKLPEYTAEERAFADDVRKSIVNVSQTDMDMIVGFSAADHREYAKKLEGKSLCELLMPFREDAPDVVFPGSSDVGDVSWLVPTSQVVTACYALGTPGHSWQLVSQTKSSLGHKGMILAAKAMAGACVDLIEKPALVEQAKAELASRLGGRSYKSAIPPEVKPRPIGKLSK
jgi:aminobenzoyl-glutamate utilization protein B